MIKERIEELFTKDNYAYDSEIISPALLQKLDRAILSNAQDSNCRTEIISLYKKFQPMKQEAPENNKLELFTALRNFASEQITQKEFIQALIIYRFLIVKSSLYPTDYSAIASSLSSIDVELAKNFIDIYKQYETNKALLFLECADFYKKTGDIQNSIEYYEKYIQIDSTKSVIFNILADLYSKTTEKNSIHKQLEYYQKAFKLKPNNRLSLHGLAFIYDKLDDRENADKYYKLLLENNPTETDYYNYGMFLIHCGQICEGHKYLTHRFNIDDINLKYPAPEPRWDLTSDIKNKTLLIHYEQGFGDTIMYCRFVPYLKNFAKKVIFVVQDELFDLIKKSEIMPLDIEIIPSKTDLNSIKFDYTMALLDIPYVLKTEPETIPFKKGYLSTDTTKTPSDKLKIGIAYSGDKNANYNSRNLTLKDFAKLAQIKGTEIYSLQKDETETIEEIIPLGSTFNNFTDSAKAIEKMDMIISTDNVILNLAGALGVKTYGLFNKTTNFRWFKTNGENVGWYNSVKPIQNKEENVWDQTLQKIIEIAKHSKKNN